MSEHCAVESSCCGPWGMPLIRAWSSEGYQYRRIEQVYRLNEAIQENITLNVNRVDRNIKF